MAFRTLGLLLLLPCAASLPVPVLFGAAKSPATPRPKPSTPRPEPQAQQRREHLPGWQLFLCSACIGLAMAPAVRAADLVNGEAVFDANCVSCHAGGGNKIYPLQTLSRSALERNGKYSVELIAQQVSNGQTPMPAFSDKLTEKSIEDVASFVYAEAEVSRLVVDLPRIGELLWGGCAELSVLEGEQDFFPRRNFGAVCLPPGAKGTIKGGPPPILFLGGESQDPKSVHDSNPQAMPPSTEIRALAAEVSWKLAASKATHPVYQTVPHGYHILRRDPGPASPDTAFDGTSDVFPPEVILDRFWMLERCCHCQTIAAQFLRVCQKTAERGILLVHDGVPVKNFFAVNGVFDCSPKRPIC
eukprot:s3909_g8.t2